MKGDPRFLCRTETNARRHKVPPVRKERGVRVDIDAVGEHIRSHAHNDSRGGGCATAADFKERVQSGGKFPGQSPGIPEEPSYRSSTHPSVGQVAR